MFSRTITLRSTDQVEGLKSLIDSNWHAMAQAGKPLVCIVQEHKAKRSPEQNARWWALLTEISEAAWVNGKQFSADCWAEFFKREFIGKEELPDGREVGLSTTKLSVPEFSDLMVKVEQYATMKLGVELCQ